MQNKYFTIILTNLFIFFQSLEAQTHIPADPHFLFQYEKKQFEGLFPIQSNVFRPIYFSTDTSLFSFLIRGETYFNTNAPNQENMDLRYFSKGSGNFKSFQFSLNNPYLLFMAEPYILSRNSKPVKNITRDGVFSVLNDKTLRTDDLSVNGSFRNLLAFVHYKGIGFGWHKGNRWWGPGFHSSLQMTNNTVPFGSQIIGTMKEIRFGSFGIYGLYTFANINKAKGEKAKYYTALNGQITWYGPIFLSFGFSRNYLTGGALSYGYEWTENDAKKIIFEGIFTSNLLEAEYTEGGHDLWDQQISGYVSITMPKRNIKLYTEIGVNDNRMYFADFLSQPDHSMATIIGVRDYGIGNNNSLIWGFEWTNLMITYTSRHRGQLGAGTWYGRKLYDYNTYFGRRWGAHSGSDSDDWYLYFGYLSDKLMIIPSFNYERHGIVTHRPAEVKMEAQTTIRYKYKDIWFGVFYEKQYEAFLGFPDYFYTDDSGNQIDSSTGKLANTRATNTLILSISKNINF